MKTENLSFSQVSSVKTKEQRFNWAKILYKILVFFPVFFFLATPFFFSLKADASTGINKQVNFQGKLVDSNGLNVADGSYSVVFTLYDASSGGTNLWTESDTVTTSAGIFQVSLGAVNTNLGNANFNSDTIYLGIKVGTDAEMTPRIRFTAVPYAFNAAALDGVVATQSASGFTLTGGTSTLKTLTLNDNTTFNTAGLTFANGKTTTFNNSLTFAGTDATTLTFQGSDTYVGRTTTDTLTNKTIGSTGLTFSGAVMDATTGTNEDFTLTPNGSGNTIFTSDADTGVKIGSSSNTPGVLSLSGGIGSNASLIVNNTNSGDLFVASQAGTTKFRIDNAGNLIDTAASTVNLSGAALTVASCSGCGGVNYWNQVNGNGVSNGGITYLGNTTTDLLIGGTATSSANFAFINNSGGGEPTASIAGSITLRNNSGDINRLNGGTLNFQTSPGGDAGLLTRLFISNAGNIGIGTTNTSPHATLDVRANSGTAPAASVSGATSMAALVVDQSGTGDLFTASTAGTTRFAINSNGYIGIAGSKADPNFYINSNTFAVDNTGNIYGATLNNYGTGNNAQVAVTATGTVISRNIADANTALTVQQANASSTGDILQLANSSSTVFKVTNTGAVGIGAATPLATFDVRGNSASIPVASVSGATNKAAFVVDNSGNGDIFTASKSGATKFTILNNGNVQINNLTNCSSMKTDTNGVLQCSTDTTTLGETTLGSAASSITVTVTAKEHMACYLDSKGTSASANALLRFNGDTAANYSYHISDSAGGGASGSTAGTSIQLNNSAASSANPITASVQITNFATTRKVVTGTADQGAIKTTLIGGSWNNTTAQITSVTFLTSTGNFNVGSDAWCEGRDVADYAENYYTTDPSVEAADVMTYDASLPAGIKKSTKAYDSQLMGVISTHPGYILDDSIGYGYGLPVPVALAGRIPVKVSTENGPIHAGDNITSSSVPGVGMKATKPGMIVGKAMEDYTNPNSEVVGKVMLFAETMQYDPDTDLADINNVEIARDVTIANTLPANNSQSYFSVKDNNGNDVTRNGIYLNLAVGNLKAGQIEAQGLTINGKDVNARLDQLEAFTRLASSSAVASSSSTMLPPALPTPTITDKEASMAAFLAKYDTNLVNIQALSVADDATIAGSLRVKGDSLVEGMLHVVDTLTAGNLIVNQAADFFGKAIFHDNVTFEQTPTFSQDTAGYATIQKSSDKTQVNFSKEYPTEPVVNATLVSTKLTDESLKQYQADGICESTDDTSSCQEKVDKVILSDTIKYVVTNRTTKGFSIRLQDNARETMTFSWTALSVGK